MPYAAIISAIDKQNEAVTLTLTTVPPWLDTLCQSQLGLGYCEIRGTPNETGTYNIRGIAEDEVGNKKQKTFKLVIKVQP